MKHSLIVKELLTDGIMGFVFLIIGITGLIMPPTLISVIIVYTVFVAEIIAIIMRLKKKFDIWDETAKVHYATARKITIDTLVFILHICIILFIAFHISIEINAYHLMIICGAVLLIQSASFIILEKRDS